MKKETKKGDRRTEFLDLYRNIYRQWSELDYYLTTQNPDDEKLKLRLAVLDDRLYKMKNAYEDSLMPLKISRNPFTGEELSFRIDDKGLNGLWWDYDMPIRPFEYAIDGFWALSGALSIRGELEGSPFKCKPGPDVPFVLKELIERPEIVAVVSQMEIGNHIGYPIVYFAKEDLGEYANYNFWGANYGVSYDSSEEYRWFENPVYTEDCDFEIARWIERGKLFWIAPGDQRLELRRDVERCPYLNLPGEKRIKTILDNRVIYEEAMDYDQLEG